MNTVTNQVFEHYDKGFVFSGQRYDNGYTSYGWVLKSDVNGNERWSKSYGNINKMVIFYGSKPTNDGGIIEIGASNQLNINCTDPLIIKLNACGEKEWCKIYNAQNCNSGGIDIFTTPGGGCMALINQWTNNQQKLIWLFRLDSLGGVIWSQAYATDSSFVSEVSYSLLKTSDSCYLITAETYYPDSLLPPNYYVLKILLIKVDINGVAQFTEPWGTGNGVISDGRVSVADANNYIYTSGRRARTSSPGGDSPTLYKTSPTGQPVSFTDLRSLSTLGTCTAINRFQDSTLAMVAVWRDVSTIDTVGVIKTNSTGAIIKTTYQSSNHITSIYGSDITYNNRLILGGYFYLTNNIQSCAYKLNSNLEFDSVYTTPFTYDSLCPHQIVSDTIPLNDCQVVVVGLDEAQKNPEKIRLHIYPNPAGEQITVDMPQYLVWQNKGSGITATTSYF